MNHLVETFRRDYAIYWANLSRTTNLLIILNISMFFLTRLVTTQNYFYTFFSLFCLGVVILGMLLPLGYHRRVGYYVTLLGFEAAATYFFVASVWYWVITNRAAALPM